VSSPVNAQAELEANKKLRNGIPKRFMRILEASALESDGML
jgi:hypothetical protein